MPQAEPVADEMPIRVFLVDDHDGVRASVRALLELYPDIVVVGEDGSAVTAGTAILSAVPDVAIVDLQLGDGSGIEVCRDVAAANSAIATLVLTAAGDDQAAMAAVLAGSRGYVLKFVRGAGLLDSVRRVACGADVLDAERRAGAIVSLRQQMTRLRTRLSAPQVEILTLIGEGVVDTEIADRLQLPVGVVAEHVSVLLDELGYPSRSARGGARAHPARPGTWG